MIERNRAYKDFGVLVNEKLNMSQQHVLAARKASRFADDINPSGVVVTLEGRGNIQRDFDRLESWA